MNNDLKRRITEEFLRTLRLLSEEDGLMHDKEEIYSFVESVHLNVEKTMDDYDINKDREAIKTFEVLSNDLKKAEDLLRSCLAGDNEGLLSIGSYNEICKFLNRNSKPKIKIPEDLYDRLQAVQVIVSKRCSDEEAR